MGRAILIVVILISTIYAGIIINVQKEMYKLPGVIVTNFISKESENVSDYTLRSSIRLASQLGLTIDDFSHTQYVYAHLHFNNFKIGNCYIDSIRYSFYDNPNRYQALTYVRGDMMGKHINYEAEIAYDFPYWVYKTPDAYYPIDMPQVNNPNNVIEDFTPYQNHGIAYGGLATRPQGTQGVDGKKCLVFDATTEDWFQVADATQLRADSTFTVAAFAKIARDYSSHGTTYNYGTLFWAASRPDSSSEMYKPTAGIWYQGGNLHFAVTLQHKNGANFELLEITKPFVPTARHPYNNDPWHMYAMVYDNGNLKAYIDTTKVGEVTNHTGNRKVRPANYGFLMGRKDLRAGAPLISDFKYFTGLMDQIAFFREALAIQDIKNYYMASLKPATTLYIRD